MITPKMSALFYAFLIVFCMVFFLVASGTGAWTGICIGVLASFLIKFRKEQNKLSQEINQLKEQLAERLATPPAETPEASEETREPAEEIQQTSAEIKPEPQAEPDSPEPQAEWAQGAKPSWDFNLPQKQTNPEPSRAHLWLQQLKQIFMKGNPVARVGILILFIGIAFLLKYLSQLGFVSLEMRHLAVAIAGIVTVLWGLKLRKRNQQFSLLMQGAGVGIVYLTGFSAAKLYQLMPPEWAFALMVIMVACSSLLAVIQNARSLAFFASLGGFAAPILVSSDSGAHITLFSYYALLNCGLLAVAWYRSWRELNVLGFLFTFIIAGMWGFLEYSPEKFWSTEPFLIFHFLLFLTVTILFSLRQPPKLTGYVDASLVFGLPLVVFSYQAKLVEPFEYGLAISAGVLALLYAALGFGLRTKQSQLRLLGESFLSLGVLFGTLAVPLSFNQEWTAITWSIEGAALLWIGLKQQRKLSRVAGMTLQLMVGLIAINLLQQLTLNPYWPVLKGL